MPQWASATLLIAIGGFVGQVANLVWQRGHCRSKKSIQARQEGAAILTSPEGYQHFRQFLRSSSTSMPGLEIGPLVGQGSCGRVFKGTDYESDITTSISGSLFIVVGY